MFSDKRKVNEVSFSTIFLKCNQSKFSVSFTDRLTNNQFILLIFCILHHTITTRTHIVKRLKNFQNENPSTHQLIKKITSRHRNTSNSKPAERFKQRLVKPSNRSTYVLPSDTNSLAKSPLPGALHPTDNPGPIRFSASSRNDNTHFLPFAGN